MTDGFASPDRLDQLCRERLRSRTDAEPPLRLPVEGEDFARVPRRADAHAAHLRRTFGRELVEIAAGVDVVALAGCELCHRRSPLRIAGERADHELPVARDRDEPRARRSSQRALVGAEVTDNGRWALQRNQIQ